MFHHTALTVLATTILHLSALPALADGAVFGGILESPGPTADFGSIKRYEVIEPITVSETGTYGYGDISIAYDLDIFLYLYEGSFDPADTNLNLVDRWDDYGPFDLSTTATYVAVIVPLDAGDTGEFAFVLTGEVDAPDAVVTGGNTEGATYQGIFDELSPTAEFDDMTPGVRAGSKGVSKAMRGASELCPYELIGPLSAAGDRDYAYADASIDTDIDMEILIYLDAFNPSDPSANFVESHDDDGIFTLDGGQSYFIVAKPLSCPPGTRGRRPFGFWGFGLQLLNEEIRTLQIPTASSWGLLSLAMGCLITGLMVLRRAA